MLRIYALKEMIKAIKLKKKQKDLLKILKKQK
jgi:hypothetical protein